MGAVPPQSPAGWVLGSGFPPRPTLGPREPGQSRGCKSGSVHIHAGRFSQSDPGKLGVHGAQVPAPGTRQLPQARLPEGAPSQGGGSGRTQPPAGASTGRTGCRMSPVWLSPGQIRAPCARPREWGQVQQRQSSGEASPVSLQEAQVPGMRQPASAAPRLEDLGSGGEGLSPAGRCGV